MKILVIDDEPKIRRGLEKLISHIEKDVIVYTAEDGLDALELLKTVTPDLIFVDIKMPNMNGLDFIAEVRENNKEVQIVIVSGYGEFEYAQKAIQYDVLGYILKPVMPAKVVEVLEKAKYHLKEKSIRTEHIEELRMKYLDEIVHFSINDTKQLDNLLEKMAIGEEYFVLVGKPRVEIEELRSRIAHLSQKICTQACQSIITRKEAQIIIVFTCNCISVCNRPILQLIEKEGLFEHTAVSEVIRDQHKLKECIVEVLDRCRMDTNGKDTSFIIERVKRYIRNNYQKKLTLQMIGNEVFLHPAYISDLFKKKTGENISDYILRTRIDASKKLLANPEYKIYMIADEAGFTNEKYFSKVFKEATGSTPNQYRKEQI